MIDLNEKQIIAFFKEKLIVSHNHEKLPIPSVKIFPETGSTNTDMKESLKKEGEASEAKSLLRHWRKARYILRTIKGAGEEDRDTAFTLRKEWEFIFLF